MRLVWFGWVSKFQEGCLYLFLFVSSLLEAEGLPKKDMREPFFSHCLFSDQVLCTVIAYLVGVEVVGVLVE